MRIGIIGAGNMGATLAAQLTRLGHQVAIANSRGPQTLTGVAAQTSATPVPITEVTSNADVVIVAIPEKSIPELPAGLLSSLPGGTVVIDTGNYVPEPRDGHIDAIDAGLPESQWVQAQLRHPVVKAFNTIRPASLAKLGIPARAAGRAAIPVASDDLGAKSAVLELADQLGFDGLDAGPLTESWRQQPGTPIYTTDLPLDAARRALADATPEQTANWRSRPPQRTKLNTAMHPSRLASVSNGVLFPPRRVCSGPRRGQAKCA
jgi:8-hydroxy-5-deazaflavin:NADPH oxidoreductase